MSEDKNELNQASKKNDSSNEKKLDVTDGAKPKKLETEINNEIKDTLSAESKKSASDTNAQPKRAPPSRDLANFRESIK